jgi:antitoxin component HigA of HigAB toxin-antitoxin module
MALPSMIDAVEHRRNSYGLTQKNWAFVLGVHPSHYSEFVNGKRALPSVARAKCFAYGVPAECLFQCRPNKDIRHIEAKLKG